MFPQTIWHSLQIYKNKSNVNNLQISQSIKLTQIKTKITLMFEKNDLNFIGVFNFSLLQTSFNVSFVPFILALTEFLWPSDAFLKICLGDFLKT